MDLIINKVMQLKIMHKSYGYGIIKILSRTSVTKSDPSVTRYRHALPLFPVSLVLIEIIKDIGIKLFLML